MPSGKLLTARVDEGGRLTLPSEITSAFDLKPGMDVTFCHTENAYRLLRPPSHLAQIYVEPTNACNLNCITCMRNIWDEPSGFMETATYHQIINHVKKSGSTPIIFFGGFGEPLLHPQIVDMVIQAKHSGARVGLITNGTLLDREMSLKMIKAGLDRLWVSLDGGVPACYEHVRPDSDLFTIIDNLSTLRMQEYQLFRTPVIEIGIAFVAMQNNILSLPDVINLGHQIGAKHFSISNVSAHTPELRKEILYEQSLHHPDIHSPGKMPLVDLPRLDINGNTLSPLAETLQSIRHTVRMVGYENNPLTGKCPFIEKGSASIRWDGNLSPCLPLLHAHTVYLDQRLRSVHPKSYGNINDRSIQEIWDDLDYLGFRQRVQMFDFSPCVFCNSCELPDSNDADCFGNNFPTCGACLWAQGFIRCP